MKTKVNKKNLSAEQFKSACINALEKKFKISKAQAESLVVACEYFSYGLVETGKGLIMATTDMSKTKFTATLSVAA